MSVKLTEVFVLFRVATVRQIVFEDGGFDKYGA